MELANIMRDGGIVGAGGAGFPSYAKLAEGADTLLVNGSECEPLLYTDLVILREELDTVLEGIKAILNGADIQSALLCIKEHTAKARSELEIFHDNAFMVALAEKLVGRTT